MANFSVNANRQMYVGSTYSASVTSGSSTGVIGAVKCITDGTKKEFYFMYKGADTVLKSDFIPLDNLTYVKAIDCADMITVMKKLKVALDSTINSGAPVAGQDYTLTINFRNFFSSGDASQYFKAASVHATTGMTAAQFYAEMKNQLDLAFAYEDGATKTSNPYLAFTYDANGVYIQEKPQEWTLGTKKQRRVMFDVLMSRIYTGGEDVVWGTVTDQTPAKASAVVGTNAIGNGKQIADLEWFCMGERGDQYRNVGYPNVIETKYLVNPDLEYHALEIHYAFTDAGVNSYRSEKEITVVFPKGAASHEYDEINAFIGAINTATGLSIATLS